MPWPMRTGPEPMTSAAGRATGGASGGEPGRRIGGVEVGRLGRELGGAGVDHREARPQADGGARRAAIRAAGEAGQRRDVPVAERGPLGGDAGRPSADAGPSSRSRCASSTRRSISARNQGAMPVTSCSSAAGTPRRSSARRRHRRESDGARNSLSNGPRGRIGHPARRPTGRPGRVVPRRVLGQEAGARLLEAAQRLVERRAEGPVDGHHLARRLHLASPASGRRPGTCRTGSAAA